MPPARLRSACASAQSDQSSLCAQWVAKYPSFLNVDREDSDQTGQTPRLIRVFVGHTCHFVGFVMRWLSYLMGTPLKGRLFREANDTPWRSIHLNMLKKNISRQYFKGNKIFLGKTTESKLFCLTWIIFSIYTGFPWFTSFYVKEYSVKPVLKTTYVKHYLYLTFNFSGPLKRK